MDEIKKEGNKLRAKFGGKIPVMVKFNNEKKTFICDKSYTVMYLISKVKESITDLKPEEGIYAFINNSILNGSATLGSLDNTYTQRNGFLIITICRENCFGF